MKWSLIVAIIVAAIVVPAVVYAASPLFINTTIDEPTPVAGDTMEDKAGMATAGDAMSDKDEAMMSDKEEEPLTEEDMSMMTDELAGVLAGAGDGIHNAEGVAKVAYVEGGSDVLRLENLRVTNGPDLYVYLATDRQANDFVDLGRLKANNGNQNYEIPEGTDLSMYDTVIVWCKQFSVLFGSAELTSSSMSA